MLSRLSGAFLPRHAAKTAYKSRPLSNASRPQLLKRTYSATALAVPVHLDKGNHKLVLPLPSGERVMSLKEHMTVSSIIEDILAEDRKVTSVSVYDKNGRVSKGTPIESLLLDDWQLQINQTRLAIKSPPRSLASGHFVSIHPDLLHNDAHLETIKSYFNGLIAQGKQSQTVEAYLAMAEDKGLSKEKALVYLRTLHKLGALLFFEHNMELKNEILLNPREIAVSIEKALGIPAARAQTREALTRHLHDLMARLKQLQPTYEAIDAKSARTSNLIAYGVLGGLIFQWILFARFTWWDFSWDVMEPVTYFTMTAELSLSGFFYYLLHRREEYTNLDMWTILYNWRFKRIARRKSFNIEEWNSVNNGIIDTQQQLSYFAD